MFNARVKYRTVGPESLMPISDAARKMGSKKELFRVKRQRPRSGICYLSDLFLNSAVIELGLWLIFRTKNQFPFSRWNHMDNILKDTSI